MHAGYHKSIKDWYTKNGRTLPWRETHDPYRILVSEMMLQQTQVERVLPKYREWLEAFPDVESLAKASKKDVLLLWSGLGYNSRALRLQQIAVRVYSDFGGSFPSTAEELMELPGVGPYTVGAILVFAFRQKHSFIDTNIKRVVHRVFVGLEFQGWQKTEKGMRELVEEVCDYGDSYTYHQALMDIGAGMCKAKKINCENCPLKNQCIAYGQIQKDPLVLNSPRVSYKKSVVPFKESKRYVRGGILKFLKAGDDRKEQEVTTYVREVLNPNKSQAEVMDILKDLQNEGLLSMQDGIVSLG